MTRRQGEKPADDANSVEASPAAPADMSPSEGGCYVRQPDGSLTREEDA